MAKLRTLDTVLLIITRSEWRHSTSNYQQNWKKKKPADVAPEKNKKRWDSKPRKQWMYQSSLERI